MQEDQTEFKPNSAPQFARLEERWRKDFPYGEDGDPYFHLRLRRSVSWLGRAEQFFHTKPQDLDIAFTCYWIAFNALYDKDPYVAPHPEARDLFKAFFRTVIGDDAERKRAIFDEIWRNFSGPIRVLLANKYVFEPFWKHHNGVAGYEDWQDKLEESKVITNKDLGRQNVHAVHEILSILFDRLYVIRNQIVHGNATWNGGRGNDQLRDGANIMAFIVPQLITSVMNNPDMKLGRPYYTLPRDTAHHPHNTTSPR